jgi:3-dehydroquinate synthase class II
MGNVPNYKVKVLHVAFRLQVENLAYEIPKIVRAINRNWVRPAMHTKGGVGFVLLTEEASERLMQRVAPVLESITAVDNYWLITPLDDIIARNGAIDPLAGFVSEAWEEVRKRNKPNYVRQPERAEAIIVGNMENFDRSTAIKMGIKGRRPRDPP